MSWRTAVKTACRLPGSETPVQGYLHAAFKAARGSRDDVSLDSVGVGNRDRGGRGQT